MNGCALLRSGRLVALEIDEPWLTTAFDLFYLKDRALSPAALDFIAEIQRIDQQVAARDQELAVTFVRRPSQTAKGRKIAASKAR